jgi:hypothetical protein
MTFIPLVSSRTGASHNKTHPAVSGDAGVVAGGNLRADPATDTRNEPTRRFAFVVCRASCADFKEGRPLGQLNEIL